MRHIYFNVQYEGLPDIGRKVASQGLMLGARAQETSPSPI